MSDEWVNTTLGEIATWGSGGTPKAGDARYYDNGTIPWAVISDVQDRAIEFTEKKITAEGARFIGHLAPANAVLVTMYGTIGRVAITRVEMATNQAIAWGVPDTTRVTAEFLFYWLRDYRSRLDKEARGATQRNINRAIIKETSIGVPPLPIQSRIVDLMAHFDNHVKNLIAERNAFAVLETSFLNETFEDEQEMLYLADIADVFDCEHKTAPPAPVGETPHGYSIGTRDIKDGFISIERAKAVSLSTWEQWSRRIQIHVGDILMSREAPVGSVGQVLGGVPLCLGQRTVAIRAHGEFGASYLAAALRSRGVQSWMNERSSGLTVPHLNVAEIKRMPVPTVMDAGRRELVSEVALNLIRSRILIVQEIESLLKFRGSLLSGLLSGEVAVEVKYDSLSSEVA